MRKFNNRSSGRNGDRRFGTASKHRAVCAECGKDCEVPFKPSGDKPVYCSSCFENVDPNRENRDTRDSKGSYEKSKNSFDMSLINDQLISVNTKLEKLIKILTPVKEDIDKEKEVKIDKVVAKKAVKKRKSIVNESVAEKKPVKKKPAKKESVKKIKKTVTKKKKSK